MGRRQKHKKPKTHPPETVLAHVRQLLERGDLRGAHKEAKALHARAPSEAHRQLLERVSLQRAEQLLRRGLRDEARNLLRELAQTGIADDEVRRDAARAYLEAGMVEQAVQFAGGGALADHPQLLAAAADQAVLFPDEAPAALPNARRTAEAVRAALQAVEQDREEDANRALADIGRDSPFADWRVFVRGLAAHYRGNLEERQRNWSRLAPERAAARIAKTLESWEGEKPTGAGGEDLDRALGQQAVLGPLKQMVQHAAAGDWGKTVELLRSARGAIRQFDPQVLERIVEIVYNRIVLDGKPQPLAKLKRAIDPPPLDPHWHRAEAIRSEHPAHFSLCDAERHWLRYEADLATLPLFSEQERALARALVWKRLTTELLREHANVEDILYGPADREITSKILSYAEKCAELAPEYAFSYRLLAKACDEVEEDDRAADAYVRLLAKFPEEFDALLWLMDYHQQGDDPEAALEYAERARKLRPLDDRLKLNTPYLRLALMRRLAVAKRFAEAREQYAIAESAVPAIREDFAVLARRALLEEKAGDLEAAEQWRSRAAELLVEPTPLWFVLAAETRRYKLPPARAKHWNDLWKKDLKKPCRSETAGAMCRVLENYLRADAVYVGRSGHITELKKYVRRCTRVKWREEDLRDVCEFLKQLEEFAQSDLSTLEKFVVKGTALFPSSPYFHFERGRLEIDKGPIDCNRHLAHASFTKAAELAQKAPGVENEHILHQAREKLTFLGEVGLQSSYLDFGGFFDDFEDDFDDDDLDEWDDSPEGAFPPMPELINNPEVREMIAAMARRFGVDPDLALDALERGELPPGVEIPPGSPPSQPPSRRKPKKKRR